MLIGRFYHVIDCGGNDLHFKLLSIENDRWFIAGCWYIYNGKFLIDNTNCSYIDSNKVFKCIEVNLAEIVHFLPEENVDKINFLRKQRIKLLLWK